MAAPTSVSAAGVTLGQYAILDSNNYIAGTSGSATTVASSMPMQILAGIKRAGGAAAQPRETNIVGDAGRTRAKITFPAAEDGSLDLMFSVFDMNAHAAFTATKVATYGGWSMILEESNVPVATNQAAIILAVDAVDETSGQVGAQRYLNLIYPVVNVTPLYASHEDINAADWQYRGSPTRASKSLTGESFSTTTHGATQAARYVVASSDYPITMHRYTRGGTANETVTLTYTPAGTHASNYIQVWQNGTQLTATTGFTVSGKTVTLVGTSTSGSVAIIMYEATDIITT